MANGYCPALLRSIESIAGENAPSRKLHVAGFLAMTFCCQNSSVSPINDGFEANGQQRTLTVSYTQRPLLTQVQDEDDCDVNNLPTRSEWDLGAMRHKQYSFFVSDETITKYCAEYAASVGVGQPATQVMREHYDRILEGANIVLRAINQDLVTLAATEFGTNVTTASNAAKTINIAPTPVMDLDAGIIQMFQDFQENEICGEPCIVGGGLFSAFTKAQMLACCSSGGIDLSRVGLPRFFFDKDTQSIWGTNQIGVFAPGSVKFISRNKYVGPYAGMRGNSMFFTMALPVQEFGCADDCLRDLVFDVQMRYIDCPTSVSVNGTAQTVNRGWQFIISKDYSLWVQPDDAFRVTDPLAGTNGTLRYVITNA
jgi:hypothetical protein